MKASLVELASTRGFVKTNMRATRTEHGPPSVHLLSSLFVLLLSFHEVAARSKMSSSYHHHHHHNRHHHRPHTSELGSESDQNVQFMLSLYRSAAGPDGRPKQHRKFGSNTVRLLRPSASSVHYFPLSRGNKIKIQIICM